MTKRSYTDGNSSKNHNNQPVVLEDICQQLRDGQSSIIGVMIESHINAGRQDVPAEGASGLKYGVSITDACVDWETTIPMLDKLNEVSSSHSLVITLLTLFHLRLQRQGANAVFRPNSMAKLVTKITSIGCIVSLVLQYAMPSKIAT